MTTFSLSEKQEQKLKQWREETLKDIKPDNLGIRESIVFIPCTAGVAVKAVCGEHYIDLTDYNNLNSSYGT